MNQNKDNSALLKYIQEQWIEYSSDLQAKRNQNAQASQVSQEIRRDNLSLQIHIIKKLKETWQIQQIKLNKIAEVEQKFELQSQYYLKRLKANPKKNLLFSKEKLSLLEISLQNPLKFDNLKAKAERMRTQFQNKSSFLKDEIKKAKLRVSLCEMQYKELVNAAKRKSD